MFKRLFVLVLLVIVTMFVTSPTRAEAAVGADRSCAQGSGSSITSLLPAASGVPATVARGAISESRPSALALGEIHRYWYSDATYTTVVGYEYLNECDGAYMFSGVRTSYMTQFRTHCWA